MSMTYPTEYKIKVIRRHENVESIKSLSQELDISQSTLCHCRNQYCTIQTAARSYTPVEFDATAKRLKKPEHMREIIRLSGFFARVPLQEKLSLLEHLHSEMGDFYSVKELCEALEVARGTFYNHIFRRVDPQKYQDEKMQLMLRIKQIFDDSEQRYGASKIRAVLAETGQQVSTKRVSSIMQELGLQSVRTDAKKFYIKLQHRKKRNLLQRHFTSDRPNQVWSAISPISKSIIPESIYAPPSACSPARVLGIASPISPAHGLSRPPSRKLMRSAAIPRS